METDVSRAYDALAADYDARVSGDVWVRRELWSQYLRCFQRGDHVLDVGCGTGTDARFLARHGICVTGIDASPAMVQRFNARLAEAGLSDRARAHVADATDLTAVVGGPFDGVVSAFGGVNTVPDLTAFGADAARLLRPGGCMVLHLVGRSSLWEWLHLVRRGRWHAAARLSRQRERIFSIGGRPVVHHLPTADEAYRHAFASHFAMRRRYGMGVLAPPPGKAWLPAWLVGLLRRTECRVHAWRPLVDWGRFYVLELIRRDS